MKTARLISVALLALASTSAFATTCSNGGTNWPTCTPPHKPSAQPSTSNVSPSSSSTSTSSAGSTSSARADSSASVSGTLTAMGGAAGAGGSASFEDWSRQNMYVLPAPVQAAPLPPGLCPQGDSMSIGILFNLFSYSRSSTRTEMECLDKVLAVIRAQTPQVSSAAIQAPLIPLPATPAPATAAAAPSAASAEASTAVKKPEVAKAQAKKASAPKNAASKPSTAPSCEETALQACKPAKRT